MDARGLGLGRLLAGVVIANVAVALLPLWVNTDDETHANNNRGSSAESVEIGTFSTRNPEGGKDNIVTPIATDSSRR